MKREKKKKKKKVVGQRCVQIRKKRKVLRGFGKVGKDAKPEKKGTRTRRMKRRGK